VGRAQVILLDTHAAVWLANNDPALGQKSCSIALAARAENQLAISAISFWEIALLVAKDRLELHDRPAKLRAELLETGVIELALTGDIALLAVELKNLHGDPADRFIAATAIAHDATLMTADARLLRWRSKVRRQNAQT
jgi:PIN domain nuclease of toxin-antitoxin system